MKTPMPTPDLIEFREWIYHAVRASVRAKWPHASIDDFERAPEGSTEVSFPDGTYYTVRVD